MLIVSDLFEIARNRMQEERRLTPSDLVAMAAFHCGGYDKPLYHVSDGSELCGPEGKSRLRVNHGAFEAYSHAFPMFSVEQLTAMSGMAGFMPFRQSFFDYFVHGSSCGLQVPDISSWWEYSKKILDDPLTQLQFFAEQFGPHMVSCKGDRAFAYSKYFEPKTAQVTMKGREIHKIYQGFIPKVPEKIVDRIKL